MGQLRADAIDTYHQLVHDTGREDPLEPKEAFNMVMRMFNDANAISDLPGAKLNGSGSDCGKKPGEANRLKNSTPGRKVICKQLAHWSSSQQN